jgi:hypothetical protein
MSMLHNIHLRDLMTLRRVIALGFSAVLAAACGPTTTIDQVWQSGVATTEPPLEKVATLFISDNTTMRHAGEDQLARQLIAQGVQATPGYAIFGDGKVKDLEAMKVQLRQMGYDGVVTMRIVDREQVVESTPATFDGYWGYWGAGYWGPGVYSPGYVYTETIYRIESAAYSLQSGRLVWSALTKTVDPDSAHDLVEDTTEIIAGQLAKRGLAG